ncbi:hypothetical protein S7711_07698 [Stachybotrys chartarum IBT 7711]|uniref:Uncharacterized protein n=1 Tax=Stachybotrys chartarum (strain CBS 109288 / IBT 7711) TaxID=1280523 RepID=A0A084B7X1_STACB|nr:hypothetical protein S7711_07698 [Stachybotrys chartarum IBT 7711]
MTPLGLRDEILPSKTEPIDFQYARDPTPWGTVTMARPNRPFGRYCEYGRRINCPGQYQGVDFNETSEGNFRSVKTDDSSTVNTTVPANYTAMFSSATAGAGNTVSGLFDIQYRRWAINFEDIIDHGEPRITGNYRYIETLIPQEDVLLKEGLIVDVSDNQGIGFRNHTVPVDLVHGGTWSEDLTWLDPVTSCVDTNLTIEIRTLDSVEDWGAEETVYLVDRGAFRDLDIRALQTPPWGDNQTLDLFGRAYKAARMYNVLVANSLNVSLPLPRGEDTIPRIDTQFGVLNSTLNMDDIIFNTYNPDLIKISEIKGLTDAYYDRNQSVLPPSDFVDRYEDGRRKLFASNFTAIRNICRGFYILDDTSIDWRATNITNPAVECGLLIGAGRSTRAVDDSDLPPPMDGLEVTRKNIYVCASGIRASIKTVDFRYNGTNGHLSNLMVERISDKEYPNEQSKPLWAVEHSEPWRMTFDPLWGIVNNSYEATEGFYTMRSGKLWLPATVTSGSLFGSRNGMDSLAAVSAPVLNMANAYDILSDQEQYVGDLSYPLVRRFSRLSSNETLASQIPSLIIADSLASLLIGTKTAIRTDPVAYPAQLSFSDPLRGLARANVVAYARVIRYDLRYAIPGLVMLSLLMLILLWTVIVLVLSPRSLLRSLRDMYNQTSTGRLATTLLYPGRSDPNESSSKWVEGDGNLVLKFGRIGNRESEYFLVVGEDSEKSLLHHGHQEHQMKTFETKDGIREQSVPLQGD